MMGGRALALLYGHRGHGAGLAICGNDVGSKGINVMANREELIRAVELSMTGDWKGAHSIVQSFEDDPTACWIHAVLHKIESDIPNSRYWYRRAGQSYEAFPDAQAELAAIKAVLTY
jgi:hypothetical protein